MNRPEPPLRVVPAPAVPAPRGPARPADAELRRDVMTELAWDPSINMSGIGVSASAGHVTLSGDLGAFGERHAVERALRGLPGLQGLVFLIDLDLTPYLQHDGADIAKGLNAALDWISSASLQNVRVQVTGSHLRLRGEMDLAGHAGSAPPAPHEA